MRISQIREAYEAGRDYGVLDFAKWEQNKFQHKGMRYHRNPYKDWGKMENGLALWWQDGYGRGWLLMKVQYLERKEANERKNRKAGDGRTGVKNAGTDGGVKRGVRRRR